MQGIDLNRPGEKKKILGAVVLGVVAIMFLWWTFVGFGGGSSTTHRIATAQASPSPVRPGKTQPEEDDLSNLTAELREVNFESPRLDPREGDRNIFSYYEPPPTPSPAQSVASATPTPTPPLLLAAVSPSNVYARTGDFSLDVSGDKFTRDLKIYFDGKDLPTRYQNPQQLTATVSGTLIANPGTHDVSVQSEDAKVYSNKVAINVAAPPTPNYSYIGMLSTNRHVDTAMLQDKSSKEVSSYLRGEVVGGRFRVTSISEKELVLVDTTLKIKHTLPMTEGERGSGVPPGRPTPKVDAEDDEP